MENKVDCIYCVVTRFTLKNSDILYEHKYELQLKSERYKMVAAVGS